MNDRMILYNVAFGYLINSQHEMLRIIIISEARHSKGDIRAKRLVSAGNGNSAQKKSNMLNPNFEEIIHSILLNTSICSLLYYVCPYVI